MRVMRIIKNVSQIDEDRCTVEMLWIGDEATLHVMMGFGISEVNFMMSDMHSVTSSFVSSGIQKKENSDSSLFSFSFSFSFDDKTFSFVF